MDETERLEQAEDRMGDSAIVAKIRECLNEPCIFWSDICSCALCLERVAVAVMAGWVCEDCGHSGEPVAVSCQCYDEYALHCRPDNKGPDCPHGSIVCPVCDLEIDALDVIKKIQKIVDSGA